MRVLVIPNDVPLPANSGGRIDVWRRLCGLREAGADVALLCWYDAARDGPPTAQVQSQINKVVSSAAYAPIQRSVQEIAGRILNLWRWPSHVASRWVTINHKAVRAWAQEFQPDVILLDGLYGGAVAHWLASELRVPLAFRSHNIEHRYMAHLQRLQGSWKSRLGLAANLIGLKRFEHSMLKAADVVLDISLDDRAWWEHQGFKHVEWLPTSVDCNFVARLSEGCKQDIDVLYFGNLHTPNNVDAVRWLLTEVRPLLRNDLTITLAGSKPSPEVRALAKATTGVSLIDSPDDMAAIIRRAKVLVNPVRFGSGVNLKSVEMLFSRATLISTTVGVKGMSETAKKCFLIADTALAFANALDEAMERAIDDEARRGQARSDFDPKRAFFSLEGLLASKHRATKDTCKDITSKDH